MNEQDGNWEEAGNREGINTEFHAYNTQKNRGGMQYVFLLDLGLDSFFLYFEDGTMGKLY